MKEPQTDHPIHDLIANRWSPYAYSDRDVSAEDLRSLLEAARWAASSYNEQPWSFLVARRTDSASFEKALACLVEANRAWAKHAAVLILTVTSARFTRNDKPNAAAEHDLGLAVGNLSLEATARGLHVHQMIGILPDEVRASYGVPEGHTPLTAIAIGYADPDGGDAAFRERDAKPRSRKSLQEFVFSGKWGDAAAL